VCLVSGRCNRAGSLAPFAVTSVTTVTNESLLRVIHKRCGFFGLFVGGVWHTLKRATESRRERMG
jgi:hypothetical protein